MGTIKVMMTTYFPLLSVSPGFRKLWLATFVSSLGDWMGLVALNLYVLNLTGSATALVAAFLAPLVDLWGVVTVMNISGVIYTLAGIYAISQLGILRRQTEAVAGVT